MAWEATVLEATASEALDSEAMELGPTEAALASVALALVAMELEHMEVAPVLVAPVLVAMEPDPTAALGMVREVGSATGSEVEMALAMGSGLVDLRRSRCWLPLVVLAQALGDLALEAQVLEVPVLEARAASVVAKTATA